MQSKKLSILILVKTCCFLLAKGFQHALKNADMSGQIVHTYVGTYCLLDRILYPYPET